MLIDLDLWEIPVRFVFRQGAAAIRSAQPQPRHGPGGARTGLGVPGPPERQPALIKYVHVLGVTATPKRKAHRATPTPSSNFHQHTVLAGLESCNSAGPAISCIINGPKHRKALALNINHPSFINTAESRSYGGVVSAMVYLCFASSHSRLAEAGIWGGPFRWAIFRTFFLGGPCSCWNILRCQCGLCTGL